MRVPSPFVSAALGARVVPLPSSATASCACSSVRPRWPSPLPPMVPARGPMGPLDVVAGAADGSALHAAPTTASATAAATHHEIRRIGAS
ncbi:MAG: hypothetical protein R2726_16100 [Acidimicrobiales bacterium]